MSMISPQYAPDIYIYIYIYIYKSTIGRHQQLEQDPALKNAEEINISIRNVIIEGLLTKKIGSSLIKDDARTP